MYFVHGHLQKNYVFLKTGLVNHAKYLLQYRKNRYQYLAGSVNETVDYTKYGGDNNKTEILATISQNNIETFEQSYDTDYETENVELIHTLDSIKNKDIYNILVVAGYLIANLGCLREKYLTLLRTADDKVSVKLKKLQDRVEPLQFDKRTRKINIRDIIRALQVDFTESEENLNNTQKIDNTLQELKYYLKECNIF